MPREKSLVRKDGEEKEKEKIRQASADGKKQW